MHAARSVRRDRARPGCGWHSPTASSPPATARGRRSWSRESTPAPPMLASASSAGRPSGQAIDNSAKALSEMLTAFGTDLARLQRTAPPIGLVQVARYANPHNSSATILLALLLDTQGRAERGACAAARDSADGRNDFGGARRPGPHPQRGEALQRSLCGRGCRRRRARRGVAATSPASATSIRR